MIITFPDQSNMNSETFGINFPAIVDGERVICVLSTEALQDINPQARGDSTNQQFEANRAAFEAIAERLIRDGKVVNGRVFIGSEHVR